jgi:anti-anti-sigma factor
MVSSPGTLGRARWLDPTILDLRVAEHGPDACVVTVGGVSDTLTAPQLGAVVTAQLAAAPRVVSHLGGVQYSGSTGLSVLVEANDLATGEGRHLR